MKTLITICGRGGSKGIPGKNIKPINGKPLIAYSIECAIDFSKKHDCIIELSTDDNEIKIVAEQFGLKTDYIRPAELANDTCGKIDVLSHLLIHAEKKHNTSFDLILDLDITSPLRNAEDLELAFASITKDKNAYNLFSVNPAARNPYFNMVEQKPDGYYGLVKSADGFLTRQAAPAVYDLNASFYFYRRIFFNDGLRSAITPRSLIYVMPHICFDLDHPIDFEFMEFLLTNNKLGFKL